MPFTFYFVYRAFGWESRHAKICTFTAHIKTQGQFKLSKRDGDKLGFPEFPLNWVGDDGETAAG
jgi:glutamyl-tRNA synthetase